MREYNIPFKQRVKVAGKKDRFGQFTFKSNEPKKDIKDTHNNGNTSNIVINNNNSNTMSNNNRSNAMINNKSNIMINNNKSNTNKSV